VHTIGAAGRAVAVAASLALAAPALAQSAKTAAAVENEQPEAESPWLIVPMFSVDPKLGTSLGVMAGYMHRFDEKSRLSMLAANAQYTSTGSTIGGVFGSASWAEDHHRLVSGVMGGKIKNDYDDYLGTGVPLQTDAELSLVFARYLYRVMGDWFGGAQFINSNFSMTGQNPFDQQVLDILGMKGFTSGGAGLVVQHDSRDVDTMPTRGWVLNMNNMAFRPEFGGDQNFDVYRADYKGFWSHGAGHVLAIRQYNQWTVDAPPEALASVQLRGYKQGQYLGKYMSSIEAEERRRLAERWTATVFAGVACLYGADKDCFAGSNAFPNIGAGIQYVIKRKEGIVLNLEFAAGKDSNYGFYMKMGYSY
jgi:hypothetical protein